MIQAFWEPPKVCQGILGILCETGAVRATTSVFRCDSLIAATSDHSHTLWVPAGSGTAAPLHADLLKQWYEQAWGHEHRQHTDILVTCFNNLITFMLIVQDFVKMMWFILQLLEVLCWDLAKDVAWLLWYDSVLRIVCVKFNRETLRPSMTMLSVKTIDCNGTWPQKHFNHLYFSKKGFSFVASYKRTQRGNTHWLTVCYSSFKICFNVLLNCELI